MSGFSLDCGNLFVDKGSIYLLSINRSDVGKLIVNEVVTLIRLRYEGKNPESATFLSSSFKFNFTTKFVKSTMKR